MEVIKVDPRDCTKWKYADRSFFEYGDPNILAEDIKRNGQIEPVSIRPLKGDGDFKYDRKHGKGVYYYTDGSRQYDGDWKEGDMHGKGVYYFVWVRS